MNYKETGPLIIADTVGFIRHLPHDLIEAFQATLEEVAEAKRSDKNQKVEQVAQEEKKHRDFKKQSVFEESKKRKAVDEPPVFGGEEQLTTEREYNPITSPQDTGFAKTKYQYGYAHQAMKTWLKGSPIAQAAERAAERLGVKIAKTQTDKKHAQSQTDEAENKEALSEFANKNFRSKR